MREHGHMIGTLAAIFMVLTAMLIMIHQGQKLDGMASLGFGVVLGNLTSSFSSSFSDRKPNQTANAPNATTLNINQEIPQEPKS